MYNCKNKTWVYLILISNIRRLNNLYPFNTVFVEGETLVSDVNVTPGSLKWVIISTQRIFVRYISPSQYLTCCKQSFYVNISCLRGSIWDVWDA